MKVLTIIGARPQFVKAAVVSRVIRETSGISEVLVHTGQHFDHEMSQIFFDEMQIPLPNYNLGIGGGTHGQNTGRMIEKIEEVLLKEKPDRVLVYGDTDSTLAGALASVKLHIPLAHVEAGLRSYNRHMPEEINRILTDHAADLLFAPTEEAVKNLEKEGLSGGKVVRTGDVMYDAALYYRAFAQCPDIEGLACSKFVLCTLHRAENTDDPVRLKNIMEALSTIAQEVPVILPLHPRTRNRLQSNFSLSSLLPPSLMIMQPVGYLKMIWLLEHCQLVMTDSGGLQKEAYFFRKPCVTLREETEWVELLHTGANMLVGANTEKIISAFHQSSMRIISNEQLYGGGKSAAMIVRKIESNR